MGYKPIEMTQEDFLKHMGMFEECFSCDNYPDNIKFMTQIRTFVAKTASEADKWTFISGIEYRFCPFCGKPLVSKEKK